MAGRVVEWQGVVGWVVGFWCSDVGLLILVAGKQAGMQ